MADKKEIDPIEPIKEEAKKVKVKILANIKYGEAIHSIGDKIYVLASELEKFEALKIVEKLVFEKEENENEVGE